MGEEREKARKIPDNLKSWKEYVEMSKNLAEAQNKINQEKIKKMRKLDFLIVFLRIIMTLWISFALWFAYMFVVTLVMKEISSMAVLTCIILAIISAILIVRKIKPNK